MSLTRSTVIAAAAYALGLAGKSRDHLPVPWTASAVMDDCAAFCSHVLWGGKPGPVIWVDGFKSAGDGHYAAGVSDLQPWDVLLFDWEGNGVGNHVEFMVADLGNGYVRTFGANGSDTRAAAYRLRPKRYIMGRFRPAWSADQPAGAAIINTPEDDVLNDADKAWLTDLVRREVTYHGTRASAAKRITDGARALLIGPGFRRSLNREQSAVVQKTYPDVVLSKREYDVLVDVLNGTGLMTPGATKAAGEGKR